MKTLLFLLASVCSAQNILINAGGIATNGYLTDQGFIGGAAYGPNSQADPGWKAQTGIFSTLRYGTAFSYDVAVSNGSCSVKLDLLENRPAVSTLGVPAAAAGARVFTVTINGVTSAPIDIFATAGAQTPYSPPPTTTLVTNGHLRIDFRASAGNAVVSGIEAMCTGPIISLMQCSKSPVSPVTVTNPDGTMTTTPGSDCSGLLYVDLVSPSGTEMKLVGGAPISPVDASAWTAVP